jgi:ABC-type nitrate/sulfonate/bicarbonate transport system permease component
MRDLTETASRHARAATIAASFAAAAALWEVAGRRTSDAFLAPLSATLLRLVELLRDGQLERQAAQSLALFGCGLALAVLVGMPLGLLLARSRALRVALEDYALVVNATPIAALVPFILSMMGYGFPPKVLVVFLFAVFPVLLHTIEGARSIDPQLLEVARSFRSGEWALWRDVMVPYTLPFAMTGIRHGTGRALVGMVVAEFLFSASGIGQLILVSSQNFDTATLMAAILVIALLGVGLMEAARALEDRFAAWRGPSR